MKNLTLLALVVTSQWMGNVGYAAPAVIGSVVSAGAFRLNGDTVISNGTLLDGTVIETDRTNSSAQLASGTRFSISPGSRARLYADRVILDKGEVRLDQGVKFRLEALGLVVLSGARSGVRSQSGSSSGRITLEGSTHLRVAALTGSFGVWNARGVLVANVAAGSALAFEPQTRAAAAVTQITGTLTEQRGHFLLTDLVTHVTVEITGPGLEAYVGQVIRVIGTLDASATPVPGASQVIAATSVEKVARAGPAPGKGPGGAAPAGTGGASAGTGISVTTIAIVGGVAAAAVLGGLAASDALPGQGGLPPLSR